MAIRTVCMYLKDHCARKFPENSLMAVGGFIILRFFSAALVTPEANGFMDEAPSLEAARSYCEISAEEEALLTGPSAPIVLLRLREDAAVGLAPSLAPGLRELGALRQFEGVLDAHAGSTPVLLEATTPAGIGRLTLNGGRGLRVDAALPGLLRSLPGVATVQLALGRPWAN